MNLLTYRFLLSERGVLNRMLAKTRPDEVITRKSFEHRLRQVEDELKTYEDRSLAPSDAYVRFRGEPVSGGRGMSARFFGEALVNFDRAVRYVGASQEVGELPDNGRVPHREDCELAILGVARGSFGFHVEGVSDELAPKGQETPVGGALKKIKAVLEAAQDAGDDEWLAAEVKGMDARALRAVADFLRHIADNEAAFTLEFRLEEVRFGDAGEVRRGAERIGEGVRALR